MQTDIMWSSNSLSITVHKVHKFDLKNGLFEEVLFQTFVPDIIFLLEALSKVHVFIGQETRNGTDNWTEWQYYFLSCSTLLKIDIIKNDGMG